MKVLGRTSNHPSNGQYPSVLRLSNILASCLVPLLRVRNLRSRADLLCGCATEVSRRPCCAGVQLRSCLNPVYR